MRTDVYTLLSLYEFFEWLGYNPFYGAQIGVNVPARSVADCSDVLYQFAYQNAAHLAREEIGDAIAQAERLIADFLGYHPAPRYTVGEKHDYPRPFDRRLLSNYTTPTAHLKSVQLYRGHIRAIGTEALTLIEAGAAIAYSDSDGDGIDDTATMTVVVPSGTQTSEIAVFFTAADRNNRPLAQWEIRPVRVSISGVNATLIFPRVLCVLPDLQLRLDPSPIDATDAASFITEADVYRRTTDTSNTGSLIWENVPVDTYYAYTGESCSPPCAVLVTTACFGLRQQEAGWVAPQPAQYDADTGAFVRLCPPRRRAPDRVEVNYLSGIPRDVNNRVSYPYNRAIALLATSLLPNRTCGCNRADQRLEYYRNIPTDKGGALRASQRELDIASATFSTNGQGAIEALRLLTPLAHWRSVNFGN